LDSGGSKRRPVAGGCADGNAASYFVMYQELFDIVACLLKARIVNSKDSRY
jgi:hypothetical protein